LARTPGSFITNAEITCRMGQLLRVGQRARARARRLV
jgi:hypothetical protein